MLEGICAVVVVGFVACLLLGLLTKGGGSPPMAGTRIKLLSGASSNVPSALSSSVSEAQVLRSFFKSTLKSSKVVDEFTFLLQLFTR